jgi:hypothetical protein
VLQKIALPAAEPDLVWCCSTFGLQGSMLDKHKLSLQLSKRSAPGSAAGSSKAGKKIKDGDGKGAKLVVRNVAFEATRKDIMGLFGPFGHIKSCRSGQAAGRRMEFTRAVKS